MKNRTRVISLIGRPNVGKSSLFNRLMRNQSKALTFDVPGVTRDRHYGIATFDDLPDHETKDAILVDTGGFYPEKMSGLEKTKKKEKGQDVNAFFELMTDHAKVAIEESDLVLFMVDVREGLNPFDHTIARVIREAGKEFWLIVNKYDSDAQVGSEIDFYQLGIDGDEMYKISSSHGLGVADLREDIQKKINELDANSPLQGVTEDSATRPVQKGVTPQEEVVGRVSIIGAPNVGKSTLLNQFTGAQRALVSDVPGTTVDPIEGFFDLYFGRDAMALDQIPVDSFHDDHLIRQYEEFRSNNPEVFSRMQEAYQSGILKGESDALPEKEDEGDSSKDEIVEGEESDTGQEEVDKLFSDAERETLEKESVESSPLDGQSLWRSIHLVDTAGIRKKKNIDGAIESQSVYRSLRCITESDIVVFMVDATLGVSHQDRRLMGIALEKGKSLIVCLNKMDLLREELPREKDKREWLEDLKAKIPWLAHCDLVPISAEEGRGLKKLKQVLKKTILVRRQRIPTGELNRVFLELIERNPIVLKKSGGKRLKVKYASMVKSNPPTFLLFTNRSRGLPENYKRYLRNGLRKFFVMDNTPVHLIFRSGGDLKRRMKVVQKRSEKSSKGEARL